MVKALEKIQELSFKAGMAETELEVRDWNMRIHQAASKALEEPFEEYEFEDKPVEECKSDKVIVVTYTPGGTNDHQNEK